MSEKLSILIVDDTQNIRVTLQLNLKRAYDVDTAATGSEAMDKVRSRFFNLALLDIKLPDADGTELLLELKKIRPDMAAIMLTGYASLETALKALNAGAEGYLVKPCPIPDLLNAVGRALEGQRLALQNRELLAEARRELAERSKVEEELRESEERFRALVQLAPDIIYRLTPDGRIVFISNSVKSLGYTPQELSGTALGALVHPDDVSRLETRLVERRTAPRSAKKIEVRMRRKGAQGESEYVHVSISARGLWNVSDEEIIRPNKTFLGCQGIIHDTTEQKRAEEAMNRYAQRLQDLRALDEAVLSAQSLESVATVALLQLPNLLPCCRASVVTFDLAAGEATVIAATGVAEKDLGASTRLTVSQFGVVNGSGRPKIRVVDDLQALASRTEAEEILLREGVRSIMCVPLVAADELLGSFNLGEEAPGAFTSEWKEIATEMAQVLALAIRQTRLKK